MINKIEKFKQIFWIAVIAITLILFFLYLRTNQFSIHKFGDMGYIRINKISGTVEAWSLSAGKGWENVTTEADMKNVVEKREKIERAEKQAVAEGIAIPEGYKLVRSPGSKGIKKMTMNDRLSAIFLLFMFIVVPIAWYKIFKKAGYSGVWCLLMFFPIINIAAMALFAFSVWPIEREPSGPGIKKVGKML